MSDGPKKVLYTTEGCAYCDEAVDKLSGDINSGEVEVCKCDYDAPRVSEEYENCNKALAEIGNEDGRIGFPTLIDTDGCEIDISNGKRYCNRD